MSENPVKNHGKKPRRNSPCKSRLENAGSYITKRNVILPDPGLKLARMQSICHLGRRLPRLYIASLLTELCHSGCEQC